MSIYGNEAVDEFYYNILEMLHYFLTVDDLLKITGEAIASYIEEKYE